jgi:cob(I)alamin adenosyltransferase
VKIYTKTGDGGETGLFAGPRVWKDDPRIEAAGTVDELNAALGLARSAGLPQSLETVVTAIQHELFAVGAELATPEPAKHGTNWTQAEDVERLEQTIDWLQDTLPPLRQFILPAGTSAAAHLHLARSICRRAERRVVTLARREPTADLRRVLCYLNRLSDLLFVLARCANAQAGSAETAWIKPQRA